MFALSVALLLDAQGTGDPNVFCLSSDQSAVHEVWEVDADSALPSGISILDAVRLADDALTNISRAIRGKFRQRILSSAAAECTASTSGVGESCIEFRTNESDPGGCGEVEKGPCGTCIPGQICVDGKCEDVCSDDGDCAGEVCVDGLCKPIFPAGYAACGSTEFPVRPADEPVFWLWSNLQIEAPFECPDTATITGSWRSLGRLTQDDVAAAIDAAAAAGRSPPAVQNIVEPGYATLNVNEDG